MPPAHLNRPSSGQPARPAALALPAQKVAAVRERILDWYRRGHRDLPWRRTRDPYAILVSEVMLQQTQVDRVIPKYHEFLARYPTLEALAAAPRAEVIRSWAPLGYNLRAVRLHEIARQAVAAYGGRLPDTVEGLLTLKGIGRYTAGAVACFAFGRATAALDTNVRRDLGRIFAADLLGAADGEAGAPWDGRAPPAAAPLGGGATADGRLAWALAEAALPPADAYDWNQALMDLGATLCVARSPRCLLCPVQARCSARVAWFPGGPRRGPAPAGDAAPVGDVAPAAAAGPAPAARPPLPLVAERRGAYAPQAPPSPKAPPHRAPRAAPQRYEGSRRWYRGRIVDVLRALPRGGVLSLDEVGRCIKPDFSAGDRAWLLELARALARDGLAALAEEAGGVTLGLPA
jgi:A/G-specific adenine glycosylase